jgi:hypothetical protein
MQIFVKNNPKIFYDWVICGIDPLIAGFLLVAIAEWTLPRKNACAHPFSLL